MPTGTLISIAKEVCRIKKYDFIGFVGNGAFKETFLIIKDGTSFALKIADPAKINIERLRREVSSTSACHSPHIVTVYESASIVWEKVNYYYMIEEYLDGGTLTTRISERTVSKHDVLYFADCLIKAIQCLKDNNLVHRDIKPDNIMFRSRSNDPILVDFGLVRDLKDYSLTKSFLPHGPGTPFYASPEQLNNEKGLISWKSDQFSLGVVLSVCLTGYHPYGQIGDAPEQIVQNVITRIGPKVWFLKEMQKIGFEFIGRMLEPWPIKRFHTIDDWLRSLKKE